MKITTIDAYTVTMKLREPYTIAYETLSSIDNVFFRLETDKGITGYGCAAPDLQVTGETAETVLTACQDIVNPCLKGVDPLRIAYQLSKLQKPLKHQPSVLAMVDMALYDILGKVAGLPFTKSSADFGSR